MHILQLYITAMKNQTQEKTGDLRVPHYVNINYKEKEVVFSTELQHNRQSKQNTERRL